MTEIVVDPSSSHCFLESAITACLGNASCWLTCSSCGATLPACALCALGLMQTPHVRCECGCDDFAGTIRVDPPNSSLPTATQP